MIYTPHITRIIGVKKSLSFIFIIFAVLFSSGFLYAQEKAPFAEIEEINEIVIPVGPEQFSNQEVYLTAEVCMRSYLNYPETNVWGNIGCTADLEQWELTGLICAEKNMLDFSVDALFVPIVTKNIDLGLHSILHTEIEFGTYVDVDFLFGGYIAHQYSPKVLFDGSVFYLMKTSHIFLLLKNRPWIVLNNLAVDLDFRFLCTPEFLCGFEISSFNKTKYNSFITPFYTLYIKFNVSKNIALNFNTQVNYIDMFTLSGNVNNITISTGVEWRVK